jgi:hypothetical protein
MLPTDLTALLIELFGDTVEINEPQSWQVNRPDLNLLILLSEDGSWLRSLVTIAPLAEAQPFLAQLLEANFEETQEARYAIYQNVLWGVAQHSLTSLLPEDFRSIILRLVAMKQRGLDRSFSQFAEQQVRTIVQAAKAKGQSLQMTLQTIERFYEEGLMGDIDQPAAERDKVLQAWKAQLERLWDEV